MVTRGLIVFIGLWLIFRDVSAVRRAKLMGSPMIIHVIVIGSGLAIHGGSADGAMAAITSAVFSASTCATSNGCMATSAGTCSIPAYSALSTLEEATVHDDLYAKVTGRVVAALEQGVAPWVRPWSTGIDTLPMNAGSGRAYRSINVVLLALVGGVDSGVTPCLAGFIEVGNETSAEIKFAGP